MAVIVMPLSTLQQSSSNLILEGHCPAKFNTNSNQRHLSKLIEVFRFTRKLQVGEFDQCLSEIWPSRARFEGSCFIELHEHINGKKLERKRGTRNNIVPLYLDLFWLVVYPPPVRVSLTAETNAPASPSLLMGCPAEESNNNSDPPPLIFPKTKMIFSVSESHLLPGIQPGVVACTCLACL